MAVWTLPGSVRTWWRLLLAMLLLAALALSARQVHASALPRVSIVVTTTADNPAADCTGNHACSLRGAVTRANSVTPYSIVTISLPGSTQHYQVRLGQLTLSHNEIHIVGAGPTGTIVDAGGPAVNGSTASARFTPPQTVARLGPPPGGAPAAPSGGQQSGNTARTNTSGGCGCRVFDVEGISAQFRGLTITGGALIVVQPDSSTRAASAEGAGIYASLYSQLLTQNVVISGNQIRATCGPRYYYVGTTQFVEDGCGAYTGAGMFALSNVGMTATEVALNSISEDCTMFNFVLAGISFGAPDTSNCFGATGGGASLGDNATISASTFDHNLVRIVCHLPPDTHYGNPECNGAAGAGLFSQANTTIANSTFTCNTAGSLTDFCANPGPIPGPTFAGCDGIGGGLVNAFDLRGTNLTITNNTALCAGGGASFGGTLGGISWLASSHVLGNSAGSPASDFGQGGGIITSAGATLDGDMIDANTAGDSGGGMLNTGNLTMNGGELAGNAAGRYGGGLSNISPTVTYGGPFTFNTEMGDAFLMGATISGNCAGDGGAASKTRCTNSGHSGEGGGVFSNGNIVQTMSSLISGNMAAGTGACGGLGGGLALEPQYSSPNYPTSGANGLQLASGTVVSKNSACNGGGIYDNALPVTIDAGKVTGNSASNNGGGVYLKGTAQAGGTPAYLTIDNAAAVSGNAAGSQTGGVWNDVLGAFVLAHGGSVTGNTGGSCPQTTLPCV
jgi:CSLREA domain-containing protein